MKSTLFKLGIAMTVIGAGLLPSSKSYGQMYHFGKFNFGYNKKANKKQNNRPFTTIGLTTYYNIPTEVEMTTKVSGNDATSRYIPEYTTSQKVESIVSYGYGLNMHFPMLTMHPKLILALTVGAEMNGIQAEFKNFNLTPYERYEATFRQTNISVPIGVAVKFGADASLVKSDRFSAALGVNVAPVYSINSLGSDYQNSRIGVEPQIFAELGAMAFMNFKLRAVYRPLGIIPVKAIPGDITSITFPTNSQVNITSAQSFQIGVVLQPMAFLWDKYHW